MRLFMRVSILICAAGGTETAMLSSTKKKRGVLVYPHWFKNSMHVQGLIGGADDGAMCERTKHWARPTSKNSTPIFYMKLVLCPYSNGDPAMAADPRVNGKCSKCGFSYRWKKLRAALLRPPFS